MPDNDQGPWGRRPQHDPTDIIALLKRLFKKTNSSGSSNNGNDITINGKLIGIIAGVIFVLWALLGIYIVSPQEEAAVLHFGKYSKTVGEGPHWLPPLINSKTIKNVAQVNTFPFSSEMLTQDENIVSVALAVQYRIENLKDFLYNVSDSTESLQQATSSALRQVVGGMTLDSILTTGREELRDKVNAQLNEILSMYHTGLVVTDVTLQPAKPPEAVTHAFDDAIKAREDEQTYINQAEAYARKVESEAEGKVARLIQDGTAYKEQIVLQSQGDTARYLALLDPYRKAPYVTGERLYLDAISDVLSHTNNVMVDNNKGSPVFYLPLDQLMKQKKITTASLPDTDASYNLSSNTSSGSSSTSANSDSFIHPRYSYSQQGGQS